MKAGRVLFAAALLVFVLAPLLMPFRELTNRAVLSLSNEDFVRLWHLSINTFALTMGTVALALPLGLALAVLLFRTSIYGRRLLLFLLVLALFVPLPIIVSSWQAILGSGGWLPLSFWFGAGDRPWATGWRAAVWIHALAAIPWAACIIGLGLTSVEPELEDEAAQVLSPWHALWRITLPRARASILAAVLFVMLQTAGEIAVTDMMLIPTLAEEVYTQFPLGRDGAVARTLLISFPGLLLVWALVLVLLARLERTLPPLVPAYRLHRPLQVGNLWQRMIVATILIALLLAPLLSLGWKLGLAGYPPEWSAAVGWHHLRSEAILLGKNLALTLVGAFATGFLTAGIALVGCWLARDCRWLRWLLFSVLTWAWVLPGPIVGIGLQDMILALVVRLPPGPWTMLLYEGPSPVPLMWAQMLRSLPAAVVFLWPMVRMFPRELFEAARLEGTHAMSEFRDIVWPLSWHGGLLTGLAASALCLGEVAASTHVLTPGWESFTKLLFDRMHYGVDNNVAALAVLMLGSLVGGALVYYSARRSAC